MITTIDEEGRLRDFVTSGLTPEPRREMVTWPGGAWLFEHLRDLPAPMRPENLPGYLHSPGLSNPTRSKTTYGVSLNDGGGHIGHSAGTRGAGRAADSAW